MTGRIPTDKMFVTKKNWNEIKSGITIDLRIYPSPTFELPNEDCIEIELKEKN